MTTYVLVPGAGGQAWFWGRLTPLLEAAGHAAVAVALPAGDESAGLEAYVDAVVAAGRAADADPGCVLVAQSMGGFSAPQACEPLGASRLVLVNAMIPRPGERLGDWWGNTGASEAAAELAVAEGRDPEAFDPWEVFFNGVPDDVVAEAKAMPEPAQAERPFADVWPLDAWPDVQIDVVSSADDRLFPLEFQRRVARERLGLSPRVVPGGHLPALACPAALAEALLQA
jgi:hypothetical protein